MASYLDLLTQPLVAQAAGTVLGAVRQGLGDVAGWFTGSSTGDWFTGSSTGSNGAGSSTGDWFTGSTTP